MTRRLPNDIAPEPLKACYCCTSTLGPYLDTLGGTPTPVAHHSEQVQQIICTTCGCRGPYNTTTQTASQGWNAIYRKDDLK